MGGLAWVLISLCFEMDVLGPDRVVYDKTFYLGQLRMKTSELNSEVAKLTREIDQRSAENSTYLTYEKRQQQ